MGKLIDKDALVAEIKRRIKERDFQMKSGCWISSTYMYEDLLDFINTLEEKDANEALRTEYEKGRADTIKEFQDALINHQGHTTKDYKKKDINFISDKEYLDRAIDFIVDREEENDYICEKLHEIPEEFKICSEDCQNLDHWCILRFLKHYKIKHLYESK
jgi:hypothetical protein